MIHVCVFYVDDDGSAWSKYIASMLKSREEFNIVVETFDISRALDKSLNQSDVYKTALLKVLLVTPNFLDAMDPHPPCLPVPDRDNNVTALLCSVEPNDLQKVLSCSAWDILTVTAESESIRKIVKHIVNKVERLEKLETKPAEQTVKTPVPKPRSRPRVTRSSSESEKPHDELEPSQNAPRSNERRPSDSAIAIPTRARYKVKLFPTRITVPPKEILAISFSDIPPGNEEVKVEIKGQRYSVRKINPYTYELIPPDLPAGRIPIDIYQGEVKLNSCPVIYEDPDMTGFSYRSFIAQILGIPSKDTSALDHKLLEYFNHSAPAGDLSMVFPIMNTPKDAGAVSRSDTPLPTLLHFATYNGLSELCARLMELPGALLAYQILNCNGDDPADLADRADCPDLADYLRNYVETKVTVDMIDDIYVTMQGRSLLYENLRPVINVDRSTDDGNYASVYSTVRTAPSHEDDDDDDIPESVYLGNRATDLVPEKLPKRGNRSTVPTKEPATRGKHVPKAVTVPRGLCLGDEIPSPGAVGSRSLEELKQMQIMVAKGQFSIEDSRKLFEAWKHKYGDSPPSFKERQKALEKLRETFRFTLEKAEESQKLLKKKKVPTATLR